MAVTFGLDISHHQDLSLDLARARADGCEFVFIKAGEGGSLVDNEFALNLAEARAAGQLAVAYWFVRSNASPAAHVALLRRVVPLDVPVIPDVETAADGSKPSLAHARACLDAIRAAGYRVPFSYIPLWYWRDIWGRPSLAGWPPLWSSRYPDNIVGLLADEWADVPSSFWNGYGGLDVAVLQFTSSARVAGYQPLDANAYRGTRAQLAALLGAAPVTQEEDDMIQIQCPAGTNEHVDFAGIQGLEKFRLMTSFGKTVDVHDLLYYGDTPPGSSDAAGVGGGFAADANGGKPWTFQPNRPGPSNTLKVPAGATCGTLRYTATHSFSISFTKD